MTSVFPLVVLGIELWAPTAAAATESLGYVYAKNVDK